MTNSDKKFSHVDSDHNPRMVDVSGKRVTARCARAGATVHLPPEIAKAIQGNEIMSAKGPVFQTAILAGVMAAKKTSELIPFCHPLGLDDCQVTLSLVDPATVYVEAVAKVNHKTGVEMEAMTAVTVAALTVYDMCKGLSHDIRISDVQLIEKTGGTNDFVRTGN